jgi:hypothetical protein
MWMAFLLLLQCKTLQKLLTQQICWLLQAAEVVDMTLTPETVAVVREDTEQLPTLLLVRLPHLL